MAAYADQEKPFDIYTAADFYEKNDIKMNLEYLTLMRLITSKVDTGTDVEYYLELKKRIIFNQRAWLSFRDSYCELTALQEGNTRAILFYEINCMYQQTRDRLKYLNTLIQFIQSSDSKVVNLL